MTGTVRVAGRANDLAALVNAVRLAVDVTGQRVYPSHAVLSSPDEAAQKIAAEVARVRRAEPDYVALLVNRHRGDPDFRPEVTEVCDRAFVPEQGVLGRVPADGLIANAGNPHDLLAVVDRRGRPARVALRQRQLLNLTRRGTPDDRAEL